MSTEGLAVRCTQNLKGEWYSTQLNVEFLWTASIIVIPQQFALVLIVLRDYVKIACNLAISNFAALSLVVNVASNSLE